MKAFKIASIVFIVTGFGCAKFKPSNTMPTAPLVPMEKELRPTDFSNKTMDTNSDYEPAPTEIKTKTGTLKLGQTQFSEVIYNYDNNLDTVHITARLKILAKDKKIISESDIDLSGNHSKDKGVVVLSQKNRAAQAPVVRAKVTCLNSNDQDEFICDRAIVDFFVLYEKQYFTDQFETVIAKKIAPLNQTEAAAIHPKTDTNLNRSSIVESNPIVNTQATTETPLPQTPSPATPIVTEIQTPTEVKKADDFDHSEFEIEGSEESLESRYQGQVLSTNLHELFLSDIESADQTPPAITEQKTTVPTDVEVEKPAEKNESQQNPKVDEKKIINPHIEQTSKGLVRPYNQAIGFPDNGSLRNATSLLKQQNTLKQNAFFYIANPARERFYSTYEMTQMIVKLGQFVSQQTQKFKLTVGNISAQRGGQLSPHKSHQIGMDVDIAYPAKDIGIQKTNRQTYSVEKTFELFKFAFEQTEYPIDRIFVDRQIIQDMCQHAHKNNEFNGPNKNIVQKLFQSIEHVDGHSDHFHLRLKCTDSQPACRAKIYKKSVGCVQKSK